MCQALWCVLFFINLYNPFKLDIIILAFQIRILILGGVKLLVKSRKVGTWQGQASNSDSFDFSTPCFFQSAINIAYLGGNKMSLILGTWCALD